MGKKIILGGSDAFLISEDDVKSKVIDYLYNTLNLSKYRYVMLDNIQKLKSLQENEHYVSPNYKGHSYFLIFMTVLNRSMCFLIDRKKLSYHKNQVDLHSLFLPKINVNTNNNMFSGSIFEGKIVKKDDNYYFLIQDCFCLMNKKILDMEIQQKMLYLNDIIKSNLAGDNVCSNFSFKVNKLYKYNDLEKLIHEIIPNCGIPSNGLIFYPKTSGIVVLYIDKKIEKVDIESKQEEKITNRSFDIVYNFKEFLNSRTYSYEKESKRKILWIKKTDIPDVYNLYEKKDNPKIGIAHIPNLKISHYCLKNISTKLVQCSCVYSNKFQKWIPISVIQ
jgi:hypothetical protein